MGDHSVSGFLSHFTKGFAKPNRYRVEFNLPRGIQSLTQDMIGVNNDALAGNIQGLNTYFNSNGGINIKCHTMNMPQRSLMTFEHKQNSAPVRFPYSATYDPVTFSFYCDSSYDTRDFFEVWQSAVVNFGTNTINFHDEYVADIHLYALDDAGNDRYHVILYNAYPLNVGILDFSYSQSNNYQTATVTMSYKSWKPSLNQEV